MTTMTTPTHIKHCRGREVRFTIIDGRPWFSLNDVFDIIGMPDGSRTYQRRRLNPGTVQKRYMETMQGFRPVFVISLRGTRAFLSRIKSPMAPELLAWMNEKFEDSQAAICPDLPTEDERVAFYLIRNNAWLGDDSIEDLTGIPPKTIARLRRQLRDLESREHPRDRLARYRMTYAVEKGTNPHPSNIIGDPQ